MSDIDPYTLINDMVDDPDLSGDLLIVGLGIARQIALGETRVRGSYLERLLGGSPYVDRDEDGRRTVFTPRTEAVLLGDVRRYRIPRGTRMCETPTPRKSACERPAPLAAGTVTDWTTGERRYVEVCTRHRAWAEDLIAANRADQPARPPRPRANRGGVLRRHLPWMDWPSIWLRLNPRWEAPSEVEAWPRPTLTLHLGDAEDVDTARPLLGVVR